MKHFESPDDHHINESNDRSKGRRASLLEFYKKSVSYFKPNNFCIAPAGIEGLGSHSLCKFALGSE
jgi:hypothetical protein